MKRRIGQLNKAHAVIKKKRTVEIVCATFLIQDLTP
jgi:hypothetical protein